MPQRHSSSLLLLVLSAGGTLFGAGCGQDPGARYAVAPEFEAYVARFESEAAARGEPLAITDLVVAFSESGFSGSELAECELNSDESPTIRVRASLWEGSNETQREQTLFHELGHCVLRRDHDPSKDDDGLPSSLMYPLRISSVVYEQNRDVYLDELYSRRGEF
ncbi:MAG: hypothetical protein IT285_12710 [Bdellovibrionales bacterium]|nr:hypothetical protein [Bdellovibrionales bacterium]